MPDFLNFGSVWLLYGALWITRNARFYIWLVLRIKLLSAFPHVVMPYVKWGWIRALYNVLRLCNGNIFFTCLIENKARDTFLFTSLMWNFQLKVSSKCMPRGWSGTIISYSGKYGITDVYFMLWKVLFDMFWSQYYVFSLASI